MTKEIIKFIAVGMLNTFIGIILIFFLYSVLGLGYWLSTGLSYFLGSIWAYFASRYFVFQYKKKDWKSVLRFASNVAVCYILAYSAAKPLVFKACSAISSQLSDESKDRIAIIFGMGIYTVLNFLGQKFVCFRTVGHEKNI